MIIRKTGLISFQLEVMNPFVLCFYHKDHFPRAKADMTPIHYLPDRDPKGDFDEKAAWRMYYGRSIPGFPMHPHRGFETITVVTQGYADHFDSYGSKGRYGAGDVQWMTAGKGIQHAELFPLLHEDRDNPLELFQIWLNLPRKNKMVEPSYKMLWREDIPQLDLYFKDKRTRVRVLAGEFGGVQALDPPPHSWAADPQNKLSILLIEMEAHSRISLPAVSPTLNRMLYTYSNNGAKLVIDGVELVEGRYAQLAGDVEVELINTDKPIRILLLAGEPIQEPIFAHGPFVMNTRDEILKAFKDYERTGFGGWPWDQDDPVLPKETPRCASYHHGAQTEYPSTKNKS